MMDDIASIGTELQKGASLPGGATSTTPFIQISRLMLVEIDSNQSNHILWTAQTKAHGPWSGTYAPVNDTNSTS